MLEVSGHQIETVAIVDDDPASRSSLAMCVEASPLSPFLVRGPLVELEDAHRLIQSEAQGCICDHQLQAKGPYAHFHGAALAAWNNQHALPSILCTQYFGKDAQMPLIRAHLKNLPVLCTPEQLEEPEDIVEAFKACASELNGLFSPTRRSWRTQVVVEALDPNDRTVSVSLPAWQVDDSIRVRIDDVPGILRDKMKVGYRSFVRANIGATQRELLYIDWQTE